MNEGGWRVSVQREKRKRRKKEKRNELKILLGGQIGHVKVVSKTGSGLCGSASWDCFEDAIASSIGCYGVAQDSGSKFFSFFLPDAIASFIGHYGVAQDPRSEFYFFFVTDTIASVIGYYGVAEDSGSKSFFKKKNGPTVQFDRIPIQSHAYCKRPIHQFFQYWIRTTKEMNKQGWQAY